MLSDRGFLISGAVVMVAAGLAIAQRGLHLGGASWRPTLDQVAWFLGAAAVVGALNLMMAWWVRRAYRRVMRTHPDAVVRPTVMMRRTRRALRHARVDLPAFLGWGFAGADSEGFFLSTRSGALLLAVPWRDVLDLDAATVVAPMLTPVRSILVVFRRRGWRIHLPIGLGQVGLGGITALPWGGGVDRLLAQWQELRESNAVTRG